MVIYNSGYTDYTMPRLDQITNLVLAHSDNQLDTISEDYILKIIYQGRIELNVIINSKIQTLDLNGTIYISDTATTLILTKKYKKKDIIQNIYINRVNYNSLIVLKLMKKYNLFFFYIANPEFDIQYYWQIYTIISATPKILSTSLAVQYNRLGYIG